MKPKTYTQEVEFEGFTLDVMFTVYPACKGSRDSLGGVKNAGPPLEPDEDESLSVENIELLGYDVTDYFESRLEAIVDLIKE
jgi:hypothetical protein